MDWDFVRDAYKLHFRDAVAHNGGPIDLFYREDELMFNTLHAIDKNRDELIT